MVKWSVNRAEIAIEEELRRAWRWARIVMVFALIFSVLGFLFSFQEGDLVGWFLSLVLVGFVSPFFVLMISGAFQYASFGMDSSSAKQVKNWSFGPLLGAGSGLGAQAKLCLEAPMDWHLLALASVPSVFAWIVAARNFYFMDKLLGLAVERDFREDDRPGFLKRDLFLVLVLCLLSFVSLLKIGSISSL